jgi:hypothetical protein
MKVRIQVVKVYDVETAHLSQVEKMQSTEIEKEGKLVSVSTDYAEVVGPDDEAVHCPPGTEVELVKNLTEEETGMGPFPKGTQGVLVNEDGDTPLFKPDGYGGGWGFYLSPSDYRPV